MEHATIPLATVLTIFFGLISVAAGIYAILLRFSFDTFTKSQEKRFVDLEHGALEMEKSFILAEKELRSEISALRERNHELDKKCLELGGNTNRATNDIGGIRDEMVHRTEWETRMTALEKKMDQIHSELRVGRYRQTPSGGMTSPYGPESKSTRGPNRP